MTVAELIRELENCPQNYNVIYLITSTTYEEVLKISVDNIFKNIELE